MEIIKSHPTPDIFVVNLWGGKGVGKSTIMAGLFWELRRRGLSAVMIPGEKWLEGDKTALLRFAEAHHEISSHRGIHEIVITDFPLPLGIYYDKTKSINFRALVMESWKEMTNLNFYIERDPGSKVPEEWLQMDKDLRSILVSSSFPFTPVPSRDPLPIILDTISEYRTREKLKKEEGGEENYNLDPSEE